MKTVKLSMSIHKANKSAFEKMLDEKTDSTVSQVEGYRIVSTGMNSLEFEITFTDQFAIWQVAFDWCLIVNRLAPLPLSKE